MKKRALDGPLLPLVRRLNEIRRANPALQRVRERRRFLETESEHLFAYAKRSGANVVVAVVNLDPFDAARGPVVVLPAHARPAAGVPARGAAHRPATSTWRIGRNYVRLEPGPEPRAAGGASAAATAADARRARRPVVRVRPAVVQARGLLRDPHPRLLRLERRRLGRPARHPGEARLPAVARRRLHLAAADLRVAAARRRLRHRRLLRPSIPTTARSRTSASSSRRRTSAASASSPTSS